MFLFCSCSWIDEKGRVFLKKGRIKFLILMLCKEANGFLGRFQKLTKMQLIFKALFALHNNDIPQMYFEIRCKTDAECLYYLIDIVG